MKIRSSLLTALLLLTNICFAQTSIYSAFSNFIADDALKHATVSFIVTDAETGKTIHEHNADMVTPTASTAKLFSTATALEILGPDYQCLTRIYTNGEIDSTGTLHGDLWIRGGGDPTIGSKYFTSSASKDAFFQDWCKQLEALGVHKIIGSVIGDASEWGYNNAPDGWSWGDMGNYYGAGPSGLSIYDNLVEFSFKSSKYAGGSTKIVSTNPSVPNLEMRNSVISATSSSDNAYIYGAPYSLDRFVTGSIPMGKSNFIVKGSLPDPEYQFAYEFNKALVDNKFEISGAPKSARKMKLKDATNRYTNFTLLITHKGETLSTIIKKTNMRSINLYAEHMLCLAAYKKKGVGSTDNGLRVLESHWKNKINTSGLEIKDGSGLSRSNGISARHFSDILLYMNTSENNLDFYNSLPISGISGTLRSLNKGQAAHGKIHAKSGTMNRIKSYAGYIESASGKRLIFALIVNNHTCSATSIKKKMEHVFNAISAY